MDSATKTTPPNTSEDLPRPPRDLRQPVPVRAILATFAIAVLLLAAWQISTILLMAFGSVLLAIVLWNLARLASRHLHLPHTAAVLGVLAAAAGVIYLLFTLAGPRVGEEFGTLAESLPEAWSQAQDLIRESALGRFLEDESTPGTAINDMIQGEGEDEIAPSEMVRDAAQQLPAIFDFVRGTVSAIAGVIVNTVVVIAVAVYLALNPQPYINGLVALFPFRRRARAQEVADEVGRSLWQWMAGQALAMVVVGVLIWLGLMLLGIELALALGVIAGVTNIVPFLGPFAAAIPAVLFALTQSPADALWVAGLYLVVQQVEGDVITPLIQKHFAGLPPVLTVLGVVSFGTLFGLPGILVATPLTLMLMVLVRRFYIEDVLGDDLPRDQTEFD